MYTLLCLVEEYLYAPPVIFTRRKTKAMPLSSMPLVSSTSAAEHRCRWYVSASGSRGPSQSGVACLFVELMWLSRLLLSAARTMDIVVVGCPPTRETRDNTRDDTQDSTVFRGSSAFPAREATKLETSNLELPETEARLSC